MSLIIAATFLAGLAATRGLFAIGVTSMGVRYVLAVCAAYLAFLALIRLWLFYVGIDRSVDLSVDGIDIVRIGGEVATDVFEFEGGGGSFGGGGATGSWGDAVDAPAVAAPVKSSGGGFNFDFDFDAEGWVIVLLFIALAGALLIAGVYVIYTAPALLSEAAFEALLAGALLRRAKKIDRPGWVGAVWRATVWPFVLIVLLAGGLGFYASHYCPSARTLGQALDCPAKDRSSPSNTAPTASQAP